MPLPPKPPLQGRPPTEHEISWVNHARTEQQNEPARHEETAKFLAGIISISLAIFIDNRPEDAPAWAQITTTIAALLWMVSALLAFAVLFPRRYRYHADSPDNIEDQWTRIASVKYRLLVASVVFFLIALALGVAVFVCQ